MISFISKANDFKILVEPLLKPAFPALKLFSQFLLKPLAFPLCIGSQRTLFTKNILLSRIINKSKIRELDLASGNENDFGKIIELTENFDEVKLSENVEKKRGNRTKSSNAIIEDNHIKKPSRKEIIDKNCFLFRSIMTKLKSRKYREANQEIVLEGKRLIKHAISAGYMPHKLFFSSGVDLEELKLPEGIRTFLLPYKNFELWSDVTTSQGIIGIFKMPTFSTLNNPQTLPLTIICDNVQDPGNLGSMLRVISSVGCCKLILMKGCVHIWEPKVIRSAAGAHFQLPETKYNFVWSDIKNEINENSKVLLADLCSQPTDGEDTDLATFRRKSEVSKSLPADCYYSLKYGNENIVIIIGGETHGISDEAYKFTLERKGSKIFIPMTNHVESLNNSVALGILVYEIKRQYELMGSEAQNPERPCEKNFDS